MRAVNTTKALALLLLGLFLLLPLGGAAWFVWQKNKIAHAKLDEVEPRYARMLGLTANAAELTQSITQANALLARHVYPATQDVTQVGNSAQQRSRDFFTTAGMDVVSSQVLPVKPSQGFEKVALAMRVEGSLMALQTGFATMAASQPTVWVDGYTVQTVGNVNAMQPVRLTVALNLYVLRAK
jgi:general secretion pathway protein M